MHLSKFEGKIVVCWVARVPLEEQRDDETGCGAALILLEAPQTLEVGCATCKDLRKSRDSSRGLTSRNNEL